MLLLLVDGLVQDSFNLTPVVDAALMSRHKFGTLAKTVSDRYHKPVDNGAVTCMPKCGHEAEANVIRETDMMITTRYDRGGWLRSRRGFIEYCSARSTV